MARFHRTLTACALAISLALPAGIAAAQMGPGRGPQAASDQNGSGSGPGYRQGYGTGMMFGGGSGRGMMWGYGPGMMFGGGWGPGMMWGYGGPGVRSGVNFSEGQLAFLKTELKITPQQMPLWDKYADAVRQSAKTMYEQHRSLFDRDWSRASLPERLDGREQMIALRLETLKATDAALKPLYAALDEEQKEIADQFLGGPMGGPFGFM
ncbi:MAG TPA: Spy/CpxP family protein refolding chaperone [Stellaceae bacterium]|nr:Spy/CpxP family protein refolding chaperone [Stellaceae bacterium]